MGTYLEVVYTLHGSENIFLGAVAAWKTEEHEGRSYQVLAGTADPIMAARLIEEAINEDGFVWVLGLHSETKQPLSGLENLYLIWGGDIHSGRVVTLSSNLGEHATRGAQSQAPADNHGANDPGPSSTTGGRETPPSPGPDQTHPLIPPPLIGGE